MENIKILLETDIGQDIDDALTLSYLLCNPRCELMGITTVSGVVDERAQMASAICRSVGRDDIDRKSTRLNSSHKHRSRMPSSA